MLKLKPKKDGNLLVMTNMAMLSAERPFVPVGGDFKGGANIHWDPIRYKWVIIDF